ncbi:MAG TPA: FtsX-like permease family protein [Bacteroidota bacterium]|jgi:putative ABC transport system permease protein|nr:FtsX-like permease family protein [Bacteroidota bacterium]
MKVLKLAIKNSFRHSLRTILTIIGISIAVMSFGFIRTVVTAWNAGVAASASNRMITSHSVSIIFTLPISYRDQLLKVPGVSGVSYGNWFGGVYKDPNDFKNFFPRIAIDPESFFSLYPEFILPEDQLAAFKKDRNACIVGQKLATEHGFKIGDIITVEGDIYPGTWDFVVRGIYKGRDATVDETQMLFQWKYLDEKVGQTQPGRTGQAGWYVLNVQNASDLATVAKTVDDMYANSRASTKTQTEKAWQQSFVSMSSAILTSLTVMSYVIIGIILLVLTNTIVMATRERIREYAVLKTLGFSGRHIIALIGGESMLIAVAGGAFGLLLTFPATGGFAKAFPTWFPIVVVEPLTIALAVASAIVAGIVAALFPSMRILRMKIVDGLRTIG